MMRPQFGRRRSNFLTSALFGHGPGGSVSVGERFGSSHADGNEARHAFRRPPRSSSRCRDKRVERGLKP